MKFAALAALATVSAANELFFEDADYGVTMNDLDDIEYTAMEWEEPAGEMPHYMLLSSTDGLNRGEALGPRTGASYVTSLNNVYRLQVQSDGNVVIYKSYNAWANSHPIWSLMKVNPAGVHDPRLVHQTDGNLCLYWNGQHQWSTGTNGKLTTKLIMAMGK